jgi:hypothetical protein
LGVVKRAVLLVVAVMSLWPAGAAVAQTTPTEPPPVTENPFLPENENVTDCLSTLPQPSCGSQNRGGWIQWTVFGVVVLGLAFIGWRVARAVRARDRASDPARREEVAAERRGP